MFDKLNVKQFRIAFWGGGLILFAIGITIMLTIMWLIGYPLVGKDAYSGQKDSNIYQLINRGISSITSQNLLP